MKIVVDDQLVNYQDEGNGDVILMLHGWGASLQTFDQMSAELSGYRVIRLDFPAFGASPRPENDWSVEDYAALVEGFLKKKKINNLLAIIAHSFGGRVTIKMAERSTIGVKKIILIGSGGIRHSKSPRQKLYRLVAKSGKQILRLPGLNRAHDMARRKLYTIAGATDYLDAGDTQGIFLKVINEDLRDSAGAISVPVLLIWGENDRETPLSDATIFHEKIQSSKLVVISDAGHFTYLDQPARVLSEIKEYLQ